MSLTKITGHYFIPTATGGGTGTPTALLNSGFSATASASASGYRQYTQIPVTSTGTEHSGIIPVETYTYPNGYSASATWGEISGTTGVDFSMYLSQASNQPMVMTGVVWTGSTIWGTASSTFTSETMYQGDYISYRDTLEYALGTLTTDSANWNASTPVNFGFLTNGGSFTANVHFEFEYTATGTALPYPGRPATEYLSGTATGSAVTYTNSTGIYTYGTAHVTGDLFGGWAADSYDALCHGAIVSAVKNGLNYIKPSALYPDSAYISGSTVTGGLASGVSGLI